MLAIDPGLHVLGAAHFVDGVLVRASPIKSPFNGRGAIAWAAMAREVERWTDGPVDVFAYEMMQLRKKNQSATVPQLFELVGVLGAISALVVDFATECEGYLPQQWNKGRPKQINHSRIWRALSPGERACFPQGTENLIKRGLDLGRPALGRTEHALEAVGIGLFHVGRL